MDALLVKDDNNTQDNEPSLRLADMRAYSTVPTAHVRDLVADGITGNGIAIYHAIADRQIDKNGYYCRSNARLSEEVGIKPRAVQYWLKRLSSLGYLKIWYIDKNRRMRISTRVQHNAPPHATQCTPPCNEMHPYKENNIKKTRQTHSLSFSSEHIERFGLGFLEGLVAAHGSDRVMGGLQAYDKADKTKIRNSKAWLTDACKKEYKPSNSQKPKRFPECTLEHENIIKSFKSKSKDNADEIFRLFSAIEQKHGYLDSGEVSKIAYKIWRSENEQSN